MADSYNQIETQIREAILSIQTGDSPNISAAAAKFDVPHQRLPTLAQVRVWVRRAPRERNLQ